MQVDRSGTPDAFLYNLETEFFGDEIERICEIDPLTSRVRAVLEKITIYPGSHHVTPEGVRSSGAPRIFSEYLRSVQMLKRERGTESNRKLPHLFIPGKTATLVPEFAVEHLPSAELQPWSMRLQ